MGFGMEPAGAASRARRFVLACALASGCGGAVAPDPATSAVAEDDPAPPDAAGIRDHGLNRNILKLWWGSGCPAFGACGCGGARDLAQEFTCQMDRLQAADIPVGVYLFDGSAWSARDSSATNSCTGADCCQWKLGDAVIQRLSRDGVKALVHFWGGCHATDQYQRVQSRLGRSLLGFYFDDGSSDQELQRAGEFMRSVAPGAWENIAKGYQNRAPSTTNAGLSRWANVAYSGDLPYEFEGMREGFTRVVAKSRYLPAPFNEFTGYAYLDPGIPDEETYYRRLHFGAFQPIMAHTPYANMDPWRPEYGPDILETFRYYAWLHQELGPYFQSYAIRMHEQPSLPLLRRGPGSYSLRVGNEIFVPFITSATQTMDIQLPGGQWVDYRNESRVVSGLLSAEPVPLGGEPAFFRLGSLIPMDVQRNYTGHGTRESAGSLTVLVYPSGTSTFRYFEDATASWITLTSTLAGSTLTLVADPGPRVPVLYRVARFNSRPSSVGIDGMRVTVNQGGTVPEVSSESAVNGATASAWFYDSAARRLIVKAVR